MCGRFGSYSDESREEFARQLDLPPADLAAAAPPRWNIAPTQDVAVVANRRTRRVELMKWGFAYRTPPPINARSETAHESPLFRDALRSEERRVGKERRSRRS